MGQRATTSIQRPRRGFSCRTSLLITIGLLLLCVMFVASFVERPLWQRPRREGIARRAAFAIRDHVWPFQQWGTRSFTLPGLQAAYGEVEYVTLTSWLEDRSDEVAASLARLLREHDTVDLFLLAHDNSFVEWVRNVPADLRRKLRLVYNTGCHDLGQKDEWIALGARAYVGHVGTSESAVFYVYFLRRWLRGLPLDAAVAASNELTEAMLHGRFLPFVSSPDSSVAGTHAERAGDGGITIDGASP
jgi:hypothetical protein